MIYKVSYYLEHVHLSVTYWTDIVKVENNVESYLGANNFNSRGVQHWGGVQTSSWWKLHTLRDRRQPDVAGGIVEFTVMAVQMRSCNWASWSAE